MIPGANLLKTAMRAIATQPVDYYQFTGRTLNDIGMEVPTYADPVSIDGSFQPVNRNLYEQYGLDFNKYYANFYTLSDLLDVTRDVSGDQIVFNGKRYQCEANNDWFQIDGWKGVLVVLIEN
jgi:E217 collar protein gp28